MAGFLFFGVVWWTGYVSLGSMVAAVSVPVLLPLLHGPAPPVPYVILAVLLCGLVLFRHRANIQRLRAGTENRVSWAKTKKGDA